MTFAEITAILSYIQYKDWRILCDSDEPISRGQWIVARIPNPPGPDMVTRKWLISKHATKSEVVQTAFKLILTAEEHEVREQFRYKGAQVFSPHFDVEALRELWESGCTDARRQVTSAGVSSLD